MSTTASELVWLEGLFQELRVSVPLPIPLHWDNRATQHLAANPFFHERARHLHTDCHFLREKQQEGLLQTHHVSSSLQLVDPMTKALGE